MAWKLQNPGATLDCGKFGGQVNVTSPQLGVHELRLEAAPLAGHICGVECDASPDIAAAWPAKFADAYVRGDDLVATFNASDGWPFAPQIYWRANTLASVNNVLGSISLQVSVSTHLLDTHPRISAVTRLPADEVLHIALSDDDHARTTPLSARTEPVVHPEGNASCLLWRLVGGLLSYVEMAPASDFRKLSLEHDKDGTCKARWDLIQEFMEKGVIRRTRLDSAFLPRNRDAEIAADCCRRLAARPLPLTT